MLVLRDDVEIDIFNICGQVEGLRDLVGGGVEGSGVSAGAVDGNNDVRDTGRGTTRRCGIKLERGIRIDDAVVSDASGYAYEVADIGLSGLCGCKDCGEIRYVALYVPGRAQRGARLRGGSVIDVGVPKIEGGGAIETGLPAVTVKSAVKTTFAQGPGHEEGGA